MTSIDMAGRSGVSVGQWGLAWTVALLIHGVVLLAWLGHRPATLSAVDAGEGLAMTISLAAAMASASAADEASERAADEPATHAENEPSSAGLYTQPPEPVAVEPTASPEQTPDEPAVPAEPEQTQPRPAESPRPKPSRRSAGAGLACGVSVVGLSSESFWRCPYENS